MHATERRISIQELSQQGRSIYLIQIKPLLTSADDGKYLALDILTCDYELGEDEISVVSRLRSRHTDAEIWLERVGRDAVINIRRHQ